MTEPSKEATTSRREFVLALVGGASCVISLHAEEPSIFRAAFPMDALTSVSQADAHVTSDVLLRQITEDLGFEYSSEILPNHRVFLPKLKHGDYDFFLMFGYEYLRHRDLMPIEPILI